MAKPAKAATTRIASTVTARYTPVSGATDAFYLDGRISGRREQRAADITLDREDRGFFFAVFAHTNSASTEEPASGRPKRALDRMHQNIKQTGRNIDTEINELADTAVEVSGRITLQHDSVRQPYFAGAVIRDSELAAITTGGGCAYLYRHDVLYPLTTDDYPLEPIDLDGNPVERLNIYCAGVAGTIRYSNIAQLQVDDCVILCNRELMEAVGQREMLRLLDDAEDQCDAAGLVMTAASAKAPGTSHQFMIGFVEAISPVERPARFANGRPVVDAIAPAAAAAKLKGVAATAGNESQELDTMPVATFPRGERKTRKQTAARESDLPFEESGMVYEDSDQSGRGKRIAFYAVIAVICVACIFAIYSMLFKDRPTTNTTQSTTAQTTTLATTTTTATTTATTKATTTATTTATTQSTSVSGLPTTYTVVSGDSLYKIAKKFYGEANQTVYDLIMEANNMTSDRLQVGQVLTIPARN